PGPLGGVACFNVLSATVLAALWWPPPPTSPFPPPPTTGCSWHSAQLVLLNSGPSPCAASKVRWKTPLPAWKRVSSAGVRPGNGSPIFVGGPLTRVLAHAATNRTRVSLTRRRPHMVKLLLAASQRPPHSGLSPSGTLPLYGTGRRRRWWSWSSNGS